MPLLPGPRMLMNRNLLYTAVTRARKCITIVGDENVFYQMVDNTTQQRRYSGLQERNKKRLCCRKQNPSHLSHMQLFFFIITTDSGSGRSNFVC